EQQRGIQRWPAVISAVQILDQVVDKRKVDVLVNLTQQVILRHQLVNTDKLESGLNRGTIAQHEQYPDILECSYKNKAPAKEPGLCQQSEGSHGEPFLVTAGVDGSGIRRGLDQFACFFQVLLQLGQGFPGEGGDLGVFGAGSPLEQFDGLLVGVDLIVGVGG